MLESPCNGCTQRRVGCHDAAVCPDWAQYETDKAAEREAFLRESQRLDLVVGYYKSKLDGMKKRGRSERA